MKKITILILASSLIGALAHAKDPVPTPVKKGVFKTWYKDSAVSVEVSSANGSVSCSIYAQKLTESNMILHGDNEIVASLQQKGYSVVKLVKPSEAQDLQRKGETVASWNSLCTDIGTFRAYISDGVKAVFTICELKVSINQGNKNLARIVGKQASIGAQAELSNAVYESVPACE